jgi:hypothetical protein
MTEKTSPELSKIKAADEKRRKRAAERQREYRGRQRGARSALPVQVRHLIDADNYMLMDGFLRQAIMTFAEEIAKADPEEITKATNRWVNGHGWVNCAKQVLATPGLGR